MSKHNFFQSLHSEIERVDTAAISRRHERLITGYTKDTSPKALIGGKPYTLFNSNDYLGLRLDPRLAEAEHLATLKYGTSPGAVRFISGSLDLYAQLEQQLAQFHGREAAMLTSSAFAANVGVLHALIKGQSKDSLIDNQALVLSDALNHRSIIDGIRIANLPSDQRKTYTHLDINEVKSMLESHIGKFERAVIITDGIFSMLGECAPLAQLRTIADQYDSQYPQGVLLIVDDSHGVGVYGAQGRGCEEVENAYADVLIGTLGKAFGTDGGYIVANQIVIDYLRESTATYIYSNSVSPGVAGAALAALQIIQSSEGAQLRKQLANHIVTLKTGIAQTAYQFAKDSDHPIQPLLVGSPEQTKALIKHLFDQSMLVTAINYPIVPKGQDEIRIQLSAMHTVEDINNLINGLCT